VHNNYYVDTSDAEQGSYLFLFASIVRQSVSLFVCVGLRRNWKSTDKKLM